MPAATKRRKVTATNATASASYSKPRGLDAFTRVSKANAIDKIIIEKNNVVDTISIGSKRKSVEEIEVKEEVATVLTTTTARNIKPLPKRVLDPKTPQNQVKESPTAPSTTKTARNLLDKFYVSTKDVATPTVPKTIKPSAQQQLPAELLDLVNLHTAFLTALSLHYAHNGTHSPADLRLLCPNVARAWGKRRVLLADIRRTLGIINSATTDTNNPKISKLSLSDYGRGKVCVEICAASWKPGRMARPVDENLLNDIYVQELKRQWKERGEISIPDFLESLPMEKVGVCESLSKMSPLLAKGQRRLEDMKSGIVIKKQLVEEKNKKKGVVVETAKGARPTLLERLRAKQIQQASLPKPATKEQLSRKAALGRIEEVVGILGMLSTCSSIGQQRISFTMPTVLGKLRDSFKSPLSKEEGDICVRLLAAEVAPNWVKIVKMGKTDALVVNRDERPTELDLQERISRVV
ncbi:hypothetical protein BJ878DRAFT_491262 [Calycina marina]|uniref:DNA replication factor Cdt1 C-terminal domain-containing protein n=1 Tax=Calycina marina TaxID=1763456 RepID=A0A9P7ZA42_9HELO|nr:hypothetical protein BJ878DRAFT_491262 [Calycina marina]